MRIIKKKILDNLSEKIGKAEGHAKEMEEININKEEDEKLQRFDLYHVIRMEKYLKQRGNPTFGNLDAYEQTSEEVEYYLSHMLSGSSPEDRYNRRKSEFYFHPSYTKMEKLDHWEDRVKARYCDGHQCIPDCPYYEENGRIEDNQVINEFINSTEILEIEDYKKELGEELVQSIINEWISSNVRFPAS